MVESKLPIPPGGATPHPIHTLRCPFPFVFLTSSQSRTKARDRQLRFQLDSGREYPHAMSSSETGHCYSGIDDSFQQLDELSLMN
eukprot:gene25914-biopygen11712